MKERPILFSGPMVRAILSGEKTQTRRVLQQQPDRDGWVKYFKLPSSAGSAYIGNATSGVSWTRVLCPYGRPGDRLWVRETWQSLHVYLDHETGYGEEIAHASAIPSPEDEWWSIAYAATDPGAGECPGDRGFPWRPSIHMPRWASRITLEVTGVRVERLQEISEGDAQAEGAVYHDGGGVGHSGWRHDYGPVYDTARSSFAALWDSIAKPGVKWAANPWVWAVEFVVAEVNR